MTPKEINICRCLNNCKVGDKIIFKYNNRSRLNHHPIEEGIVLGVNYFRYLATIIPEGDYPYVERFCNDLSTSNWTITPHDFEVIKIVKAAR